MIWLLIVASHKWPLALLTLDLFLMNEQIGSYFAFTTQARKKRSSFLYITNKVIIHVRHLQSLLHNIYITTNVLMYKSDEPRF